MEWIYPPHIQDQINGIDEQVEMLLKFKIRLLQNSVPKLLLTEEEVAKIDCDKVLIKLKPKPKTNADRIRNMSDEELYKFLRYFGVCRICKHRKDEGCDNRGCTPEEADGFLKEWLQAEVKEGSTDERPD